jgi:hypothetical protein
LPTFDIIHLFNVSHSSGWVAVSDCGSICISLVTNIEHLCCVYLLAVHSFFCEVFKILLVFYWIVY